MTRSRQSLLSLAAAAAVLAGLSVLVERLQFAPSGLTANDVSLRKYESLREHARREGPSDLVFVGSSLSYRGIDPAVVRAALSSGAAPAREPRVYNFAVWGHGSPTYPVLTGLLLRADRPRVVAVELGHRAIEATPGKGQASTQRVLESAYGRTFSDPIAARGQLRRWLLDHWSLWSCAPRLRALLVGGRFETMARGGLDPARGFLAPAAASEGELGHEHRRGLLWQTSARHLEGVERAVRMAQAAGAEVVLYGVPVRAPSLELLVNPDDPLPALRSITREMAARLDVQVIQLPDPIWGDHQFADLDHLNQSGAAAWSRTLGAALAALYPELRSPPIDEPVLATRRTDPGTPAPPR
jgi:hypothetical protein